MRRIFSILILAFIVFLILMVAFDFVRTPVINFFTLIAGPAVTNTAVGGVNMVISSVGLGGFAAIIGAVGLIGGVLVHLLWVKTDWRLRRWGSQRISKDLGAQPTTNLPATPVGATTRPPVKTETPVVAPTPKTEPVAATPPLEEVKK